MERGFIETRAEDQFTDIEREKIAASGARVVWGPPLYDVQLPRPRKTWCALVWLDDEVVSHAGILERTVDVGGKAIRVGGLCGVWTVPEQQGRGIGSAGVEAAAAFIRDELKAEFGMLFCRPRREQFYGRLGWQKVAEPSTLTFDGPPGKMALPMTTMVLSCTEQTWPEGTIDLRGLPW